MCNRATVATKFARSQTCNTGKSVTVFTGTKDCFQYLEQLINLHKVVMFVIITYPVLQGSPLLTADVGMCELTLVLAGRQLCIMLLIILYVYITTLRLKMSNCYCLLLQLFTLYHKNKTTTKWVYVHTHIFITIKCHFFWFGGRRVQ